MSVDTTVHIGHVELRNPVIVSSGVIGFGIDYARWVDLSRLGAIVLNGLTAAPRAGNIPPRIVEAPSGVLNSVGLQNPGVVEFLRSDLHTVAQFPTTKIANVAGSTMEEFTAVIAALDDYALDMFELNTACPSAGENGLAWGTNAGAVRQLTEAARTVTDKPLIVKLTPNVTKIVDVAAAARDGGADAVSLINTLGGMAINPYTRQPMLGSVTGGLSGPAIKPIALRMVYEVARAALGIPVIGIGGITTGIDAAEFMIAGATAVMVGTETMRSPSAPERIAHELAVFAEQQGERTLRDLTGTIQT